MSFDFYSIGYWVCISLGLLVIAVVCFAAIFVFWGVIGLLFEGYRPRLFNDSFPTVPILRFKKTFTQMKNHQVTFWGFCFHNLIFGVTQFTEKEQPHDH